MFMPLVLTLICSSMLHVHGMCVACAWHVHVHVHMHVHGIRMVCAGYMHMHMHMHMYMYVCACLLEHALQDVVLKVCVVLVRDGHLVRA
jgi:hypothetical protein